MRNQHLLVDEHTKGKESSAHCTLWSTDRLRWPQTILGREKAECRRRAVDSSAGKTQCRLIKTYIDQESGERICIYKRHGTGLDELTLSMSAFLNCQKISSARELQNKSNC